MWSGVTSPAGYSMENRPVRHSLSRKTCNAIEPQLLGKMVTTTWFVLIRAYVCPWKMRYLKNGCNELLLWLLT